MRFGGRRGALIGVLFLASVASSGGQSRTTRAPESVDRPSLADDAVRAFAIYFGGNGNDAARAIAVDPQGNVYVIGDTRSSDFHPSVPLPQSLTGEATVAQFLLKLDSTGVPVYARRLAISAAFPAVDIAVGPDSAAYVLVVEPNFSHVIKFDPSGSIQLYNVTFGGIGRALVRLSAIVVDMDGQAVITGTTSFSPDVFVAKLDSQGGILYQKVMPGGRSGATPNDVALDAAGNVYVAGQTSSDDFPTTGTAVQPRFSGGTCFTGTRTPQPFPCPDAFLIKLDRNGELVYSTYFGGTSIDRAVAVAADREGSAFISGTTISSDLPTVNALQAQCRSGFSDTQCGDAFVAKINPSGAAIVFATYLGGTKNESIAGIAVNGAGSVHIVGSIVGNDLPIYRAVQPASGGGVVFVSDDGGRTWATGLGLDANAIRQFASASRSQFVYAATNRGVFRSGDGGYSWAGKGDVPGRDVRGVVVDPAGVVYAAVNGGGVFKSVDDGGTWTAMNSGLTRTTFGGVLVNAIGLAPSAPSTLYVECNDGTFVSRDGATSWQRVRNPSGSTGKILVDPVDPQTIYSIPATAGFGGALKSTDGGVTSRPLGPVPRLLPTQGPSGEGRALDVINSMAIDPADRRTLYAGYIGGVSRSRDGGATWQPFTDGLPNNVSYTVATDPGAPGTVYAAGGAYLTDVGLYRSTDGTGRWESVNPRLSGELTANMGRLLIGTRTDQSDAFVVALDPRGSLLWSTYLGDRQHDGSAGIAIAGNVVHVVGWTESPRWLLPTMGGRPFGGAQDLFWARLYDPVRR
jgi:hypothetical protein